MIFIVVSTFIIQDDLFRLAVSFGVTRLQFFIGSVCYIVLQSAVFSFLQVIFLQDILYSIGNTSFRRTISTTVYCTIFILCYNSKFLSSSSCF